MIKKILAQVLSLLLMFSCCMAVTVSADALPDLADNATLAKPANLLAGAAITDTAETFVQSTDSSVHNFAKGSGTAVDIGNTTTDDGKVAVYNNAVFGDGVISQGSTPVGGIRPTSATKDYLVSVLTANKNVVVSIDVWNRKSDDTELKMLIGAYQQGSFTVLQKEYPNYPDGATVSTDYTNPTTIFGTLKMPSNTTDKYPHIVVGYPEGGTKTHNVGFDLNSFYIAEEAANKIEVTADKTTMYAGIGDSINVSASVLNQVGSEGYIEQGVTWYAVNTERNAEVSGLSVSAEGVVTATDKVTPGEYAIVAVSQANSTLVKGITINVKSLKNDNDTLPKPANLITGAVGESNFETTHVTTLTGNTDGDGVVGISYANRLDNGELTTTDAVSRGIRPTVALQDTYLSDVMTEGKKIVVSMSAKADTVGLEQTVLIGANKNTDPYFWVIPAEYPSYPSGQAVGNEWETVASTLLMPANASTGTRITIGFPEDSANVDDENIVSDKRVSLDTTTFYVAEEAANKITVTANGSTTFTQGAAGTVNLTAAVLNQIGSQGYVSQDITWYAMNADRTVLTDEISVSNGVVTVPETASAGTYNIVAVADADRNLVKGIEITVEAAAPVITETTITKDGTNVIISAKDNISNAVLIFAKYNSDGRMLTADFTNDKVTVSANGTATIEIPDDFTEGTVKIMLWENLTSCKPLATAID